MIERSCAVENENSVLDEAIKAIKEDINYIEANIRPLRVIATYLVDDEVSAARNMILGMERAIKLIEEAGKPKKSEVYAIMHRTDQKIMLIEKDKDWLQSLLFACKARGGDSDKYVIVKITEE